MRSLSDLVYFTHRIDGVVHSGWYRLVQRDGIQLITVGMLQDLSLDGRSPEKVARDALEQFVS
jgi:hypothetical protein